MSFGSEMVERILAGRKTQTRRIVKEPPAWAERAGFSAFTPRGFVSFRGASSRGYGETFSKSDYGVDGDLLWVREFWCSMERDLKSARSQHEDAMSDSPIYYRARVHEDTGLDWKVPSKMPKWMARIWLEITEVSVVRLGDIKPRDAWAEGYYCSCTRPVPQCAGNSEAFLAGEWASSKKPTDWVWVYQFKRVERPA